MKRIAGALALGAGLLAAAPAALGGETVPDAAEPRRDAGVEGILAELDAQRAEIDALRLRLSVQDGGGGVDEAVKKYLESEEGQKLLGKGKTTFKASWKDGLSFETDDKEFSLKVNGRIMYDMVFPDADDEVEVLVGDFDALSGFRRLRIEMSGTIYKNVYYANVIDFSATPHTSKDSYIGYKGIPGLGHFQVGYFKEPVGLEELTSSKYITFMERSIVTNAFAPAHSHGMMFHNSMAEDRINWAVGDFWDAVAGGVGADRIQHSFTGRLVGAPVLDAKEKTVIHLGASLQMRSPDTENDRFRVRPEVPFTVRTQDTGTISVDSEDILGLEFAVARGPLSMQAEWYKARIEGHPDVVGAPDPTFTGYYVAASWLVTGENRPYKGGTFGRVKPASNFKGKSGTGALELAARYSALDLEDDTVMGRVGHDATFGLNWYLNPNARVMVNYVMYRLHHVGDVNSVEVRFQIDF